jgi:twitching motility protein PilT
MTATSAVRNLIKEGKTNQLRNVIASHSAEGMQTLEAGLSDLLESGTIDHESALAVSMYPKEIRRPAPAAPPVPESTGRRGRRK